MGFIICYIYCRVEKKIVLVGPELVIATIFGSGSFVASRAVKRVYEWTYNLDKKCVWI